MIFRSPRALIGEHESLHTRLSRLTTVGGDVEDAARVVETVLHPHFEREERIAFPPLGLLPLLTARVTPEMAEVLRLVDEFKAGLPTYLEEHRVIVRGLDGLAEVAREADKMDIVRFTIELKRHAQAEEEIYYPASILIGEYIRKTLQMK